MAIAITDYREKDPAAFQALFREGWQEASLEQRLQGFMACDLAQNYASAAHDISMIEAAELNAQTPFRFSPAEGDAVSKIEINRSLMEAAQPYEAMRAFQSAECVKANLNEYQRLPEEKAVQAYADQQSRSFYEGMGNSPGYYLHTMAHPQELELSSSLGEGQRSANSYASVEGIDHKMPSLARSNEGQDQAASKAREESRDRDQDQFYSMSY